MLRSSFLLTHEKPPQSLPRDPKQGKCANTRKNAPETRQKGKTAPICMLDLRDPSVRRSIRARVNQSSGDPSVRRLLPADTLFREPLRPSRTSSTSSSCRRRLSCISKKSLEAPIEHIFRCPPTLSTAKQTVRMKRASRACEKAFHCSRQSRLAAPARARYPAWAAGIGSGGTRPGTRGRPDRSICTTGDAPRSASPHPKSISPS